MVIDEWKEAWRRRERGPARLRKEMVAHWAFGAMVTLLAASHSEEAEAGLYPSWYAGWLSALLCWEDTQSYTLRHKWSVRYCFSQYSLSVFLCLKTDPHINKSTNCRVRPILDFYNRYWYSYLKGRMILCQKHSMISWVICNYKEG